MFNGREIIRFGPIVQGVVKRNFCEKQLAIEGWTVYDLLKFLMIGKIAKIDDLSWVFRLRS